MPLLECRASSITLIIPRASFTVKFSTCGTDGRGTGKLATKFAATRGAVIFALACQIEICARARAGGVELLVCAVCNEMRSNDSTRTCRGFVTPRTVAPAPLLLLQLPVAYLQDGPSFASRGQSPVPELRCVPLGSVSHDTHFCCPPCLLWTGTAATIFNGCFCFAMHITIRFLQRRFSASWAWRQHWSSPVSGRSTMNVAGS